MEIEIHCPVHAQKEMLDLPNSYDNFEGDIQCPFPVSDELGGDGAHLIIKIVGGVLISLKRG